MEEGEEEEKEEGEGRGRREWERKGQEKADNHALRPQTTDLIFGSSF